MSTTRLTKKLNFRLKKRLRRDILLRLYICASRLILIKTKGEQLKNDNSDAKVRLGKAWEHVAGSQFKYLMVFEKYPLKEEGAYNFSDFSRIIQEL